jgi:hypothetical protein
MNESNPPRVVIWPPWDVKNGGFRRRRYRAAIVLVRANVSAAVGELLSRNLSKEEDAGGVRFICEHCALLENSK